MSTSRTGIVGICGLTGSADFKKLNAHLMNPVVRPLGLGMVRSAQQSTAVAIAVAPDAPAKKRLRQKAGSKLNKLEARFFEHLKATMPEHQHYAQSVNFLIANGCRLLPDFVSVSKVSGMWIAWETKPRTFAREDSIVKIKVAASIYPLVQWRLAWEDEHNIWQHQVVLS